MRKTRRLRAISSPAMFDGFATASGDVLIKETFFGDTDLNGTVNPANYWSIDNGYANLLTCWVNGDFNYDGTTNAADYSLIDTAYAFQSTDGAPLARRCRRWRAFSSWLLSGSPRRLLLWWFGGADNAHESQFPLFLATPIQNAMYDSADLRRQVMVPIRC
jgi:hypothetical protein